MAAVLKPNSFIIVVGLPSSGKTFFSKRISKNLNIPLLDDPHDLKDVIKFINQKPCGIMCSPLFCDKNYRKKLKQSLKGFGVKIRWLFFENNPEQCLKNDKHRKSKAQDDINYFSSIYHIPSHIKTIKVFNRKGNQK